MYFKNDKTNRYIDRFNSRIIFPVNDISGNTIAFGGRIIKENKLAKYINSPETEFYKKGNMIFNLDKAKSSRIETNEVIIVEGYMDVVSLFSAGIKNVVSNSGTALTERQIDIIWKFFSNPIICLDGDESGQKAASRIAERLFSLINDSKKIYFSVIPEGNDPDDFIRKNGKEKFLSLLNQKQIIQSYIWNYLLKKVDTKNPYEFSKFEKDIKRLCYSIKDETLKKYVLEDFLEKLRNLTPIQNTRRVNYNYKNFKQSKNYQILNETKNLYDKKNHFSKKEIKEFAVLYIMINYYDVTSAKVEDISKIKFSSERNDSLKKLIISLILEGNDKETVLSKSHAFDEKLIQEIKENSSIKIITQVKNNEAVLELLDELLAELKELENLDKIESIERKLMNNLDETSYSELCEA